jgi:hypothetical protein
MKMKGKWLIVAVPVGIMLVAPLVVPLFCPWSGINSVHQDINIKTGQARHSRSLWFVRVSETIRETPISIALRGERIDVADIKAWHRVSTFSPGISNSPHYVFHGALHQAHQVDMIFSVLKPTAERKREIAKTILTVWQTSGRDSGADGYVRALRREAVERLAGLNAP